MAKEDTSLQVKDVPGADLPAFMRGKEIQGLENLGDFIIPPRIKIVQKQAGDELLAQFKTADAILQPTNELLINYDKDSDFNGFHFVPIFFYPEWVTWNDIKLKGQEPAIRYRTTDPTDPVVAKCRDKRLREEDIPGREGMKMKHLEHLNYIIMLVDHPLEGTPVVLTYSGGGWGCGSNLASLIKMRKADIYGCVFSANMTYNSNNQGSWYSLAPSNPSARSSWITDENQYNALAELHKEFKEHHKHSRLKTDLENDVATPVDSAATAASDEF